MPAAPVCNDNNAIYTGAAPINRQEKFLKLSVVGSDCGGGKLSLLLNLCLSTHAIKKHTQRCKNQIRHTEHEQNAPEIAGSHIAAV